MLSTIYGVFEYFTHLVKFMQYSYAWVCNYVCSAKVRESIVVSVAWWYGGYKRPSDRPGKLRMPPAFHMPGMSEVWVLGPPASYAMMLCSLSSFHCIYCCIYCMGNAIVIGKYEALVAGFMKPKPQVIMKSYRVNVFMTLPLNKYGFYSPQFLRLCFTFLSFSFLFSFGFVFLKLQCDKTSVPWSAAPVIATLRLSIGLQEAVRLTSFMELRCDKTSVPWSASPVIATLGLSIGLREAVRLSSFRSFNIIGPVSSGLPMVLATLELFVDLREAIGVLGMVSPVCSGLPTRQKRQLGLPAATPRASTPLILRGFNTIGSTCSGLPMVIATLRLSVGQVGTLRGCDGVVLACDGLPPVNVAIVLLFASLMVRRRKPCLGIIVLEPTSSGLPLVLATLVLTLDPESTLSGRNIVVSSSAGMLMVYGALALYIASPRVLFSLFLFTSNCRPRPYEHCCKTHNSMQRSCRNHFDPCAHRVSMVRYSATWASTNQGQWYLPTLGEISMLLNSYLLGNDCHGGGFTYCYWGGMCSCCWFVNVESVYSHTDSRTACVGSPVALFSLPFEARPTDPLRREVFRQCQEGSAWFAPTAVPPRTGHALPPCKERSVGPVPKPKGKRRRLN